MSSKLPINRQQAMKLLEKYNSDKSDFNHFLESEAVMKELAEKFNENVEYWSMLGLLHDVDWGLTKNDVSTHLTKAPDILRQAGFDEDFIKTLVSHGHGFDELPALKSKTRNEKIEFALAAAETVTGLIHAYALMRGKKVSDMEVSGLKKKFKDKAFAAKIDREIILEIEKTGLSLDEFFQLAINGIKKIASEVELQ
ncbi:MAG TPA: HDIG domain-containing protein [Candidatus Pacearchaeota archaeon]|nr:HDIG domain-containing protein [Candidatus Pacearchaeota archaeon]